MPQSYREGWKARTSSGTAASRRDHAGLERVHTAFSPPRDRIVLSLVAVEYNRHGPVRRKPSHLIRTHAKQTMTGTYDWNPIPHRLDVVCPTCQQRAEFEFAEVVRVNLKAEVEFFRKSSIFGYQKFEDSCGHIWHGTLFFEGLHGNPCQAIHELPLGDSAEDWALTPTRP